MYAGTTMRPHSGNVIGTHQRIDKIARKHITTLIGSKEFPSIQEILHFEGNNGPDGVKRKSPSIDEPWHFLDPNKEHDVSLIELINDHIFNLTAALREKDQTRAAFEAAWAAHAIVDGLTPAHHYPLADKIEELFGMPHHERTTIREKNIIKGETRRDTIAKNWEYWGAGGVFSAHYLFEFGVTTTMIGRTYKIPIKKKDFVDLKLLGYEAVFRKSLQKIVDLDVFEMFQKNGWNWKVARIVHQKLLPEIIKAVVLAWYFALDDAEVAREG